MAETDRQFADKMDTGQMAPLWNVMAHLVCAEPAQNRAPYAWAVARAIDDKEFDSAPKTTVVVPPWSQIEIAARAQTNLFRFTDRAAQQALGLCRSEGYAV